MIFARVVFWIAGALGLAAVDDHPTTAVSRGEVYATIPDCKCLHPRPSRPAFYRVVCDHGAFEPPRGKLNVVQGIAA
jgi:hypothetical protein